MRHALIVPFTIAAAAATAQAIEFPTDTSVVIVRTIDQYGMAVTEFIGQPGAMYQCIAMNSSEAPLAVAVAMSDVGQVIFQGVDASAVAKVACRKL